MDEVCVNPQEVVTAPLELCSDMSCYLEKKSYMTT